MKRDADPTADPESTLSTAVPRSDAERRILDHYARTMDFAGFRALQGRHLALRSKPAKYLDFTTWLRARLEVVEALDLIESPPLRILDLGCGPSHFGLACRVLGHDVTGVDLPDNALYNDLVAFFDVRRVAQPISAGRALVEEVGRDFDLVTAFSANFFQKPDGTLFTESEWRFFFEDLSTRLRPGGRVYFKLNPLRDHEGMHPEDAEFASMIESLGGTASGVIVRFDDGVGNGRH